MPLSPPSGVSSSIKRTGIFITSRLGVGSRSAGAAALAILLLANKLSTGLAPVNTPVKITAVEDSVTQHGIGSEMYGLVRKVFDQNGQPNITCVAVAENGSAVAATATLAFATNATTDGVIRVTVKGVLLEEVTVQSGTTPTQAATAVRDVVNNRPELPVTASSAAGTVTLTARQKGPRGNLISVRAEFSVNTSMTVALNGGTASTSVSGKMGTGTATPGSGADTFQNAIDAVYAQKYDRIVAACDDATNIALFKAWMTQAAAIMEGRLQQTVIGLVSDLPTAVTQSTATNNARIQFGWHYNADDLPGEIAAQLAAARVYGDGELKGEESYRAANLDSVQLLTTRVQPVAADEPNGTEINSALSAGLTPLVRSASNPGFVEIHRSVTSRFLDSNNVPNYAVLDTSKVTVTDYIADDLRSKIANEFRGKNLAPDPEDDRGPESPDVVYPSMIKGFIADQLIEYERRGLIVLVRENLYKLVVEIDVTNPALVISYIPADVIEGFHTFAGEVQQIG